MSNHAGLVSKLEAISDELAQARTQEERDAIAAPYDSALGGIKETCESEPPPQPLRRPLSDPRPYPIDALGGPLKAAAAAIHDRVQAPVPICANSVLATASLAIQGSSILKVDVMQNALT